VAWLKMNIKSLYLLAITTFIVPSAMATCNKNLSATELTSCEFLESKGIIYSKWKVNFTNPPEIKKDKKPTSQTIVFNKKINSHRN